MTEDIPEATPIPDNPIPMDYEHLRTKIAELGAQMDACKLPDIGAMKKTLDSIAERRAGVKEKLREASALLDSKISELKKNEAGTG